MNRSVVLKVFGTSHHWAVENAPYVVTTAGA
jgi:hypothetical protein